MKPKQRFISALQFQAPDDMVAFMEVEFHLYREAWGKEPIVGQEYARLSAKEKEQALYHNAELMVKTAQRFGHDAIRDIGGYWELSPGEPAYLWLPEEEDRINQIRALRKVGGDDYFILGSCCPTMPMPDGPHFESFIYDLYEKPDEIKAVNEANLLYGIEYQQRLLDAGADGILNACDVAFNSGPLLSPAMMDEFFFPYFFRWVDSLKRQGIPSVWHTDGNISILMDRVLESGVNAIQCVDPLAGMDIVALKKQVEGRLTLIGNMDCSVLQSGPAEAIRDQCRYILEGCRGSGGFVFSACNVIFRGIPLENYEVMVQARQEFGREG